MKKNIHTQNQYLARIKGVKSTVFNFLLNTAILETLTIIFKWEIIPLWISNIMLTLTHNTDAGVLLLIKHSENSQKTCYV